jgi:hypothetical protein
MYPYNMIGLGATIFYFLLFVVFFPGLSLIDKHYYSIQSFSNQRDNDSSSTSGVRVCNLDLSEFINKSHPRRQSVIYKPLNSRRFIYV